MIQQLSPQTGPFACEPSSVHAQPCNDSSTFGEMVITFAGTPLRMAQYGALREWREFSSEEKPHCSEPLIPETPSNATSEDGADWDPDPGSPGSEQRRVLYSMLRRQQRQAMGGARERNRGAPDDAVDTVDTVEQGLAPALAAGAAAVQSSDAPLGSKGRYAVVKQARPHAGRIRWSEEALPRPQTSPACRSEGLQESPLSCNPSSVYELLAMGSSLNTPLRRTQYEALRMAQYGALREWREFSSEEEPHSPADGHPSEPLMPKAPSGSSDVATCHEADLIMEGSDVQASAPDAARSNQATQALAKDMISRAVDCTTSTLAYSEPPLPLSPPPVLAEASQEAGETASEDGADWDPDPGSPGSEQRRVL